MRPLLSSLNFKTIGNINNVPLGNVNGNLVNKYGTSVISFNTNTIPTGSHTLNSSIKRINQSRNF